jgi:hypothetical protein
MGCGPSSAEQQQSNYQEPYQSQYNYNQPQEYAPAGSNLLLDDDSPEYTRGRAYPLGRKAFEEKNPVKTPTVGSAKPQNLNPATIPWQVLNHIIIFHDGHNVQFNYLRTLFLTHT